MIDAALALLGTIIAGMVEMKTGDALWQGLLRIERHLRNPLKRAFEEAVDESIDELAENERHLKEAFLDLKSKWKVLRVEETARLDKSVVNGIFRESGLPSKYCDQLYDRVNEKYLKAFADVAKKSEGVFIHYVIRSLNELEKDSLERKKDAECLLLFCRKFGLGVEEISAELKKLQRHILRIEVKTDLTKAGVRRLEKGLRYLTDLIEYMSDSSSDMPRQKIGNQPKQSKFPRIGKLEGELSDLDIVGFIDKTIERYVPRKFSENSFLFKTFLPRYVCDSEALTKTVAEPFWEFLDLGGKRFRSALFLLVCEALGKNSEELVDFAVIPEIIHNGMMIVEDVECLYDHRRGKPCIYKVYGLDIAINSGNTMYYLSLLPLLENRSRIGPDKTLEIYDIYLEEMTNLSLGQAMDMEWHRRLIKGEIMTENDYLQVLSFKMGSLARMAARMAGILCEAEQGLSEKLARFAESMFIVFQFKIDLMDLTEWTTITWKDAAEAMSNIAVIHTLQQGSDSDKKGLLQILKAHTTGNLGSKGKVRAILERCGSIEYSKGLAQSMVKESWRSVAQQLPPSEAKRKLDAFVKSLI
jgi:geranylgeranyl pyrophosphate synthase